MYPNQGHGHHGHHGHHNHHSNPEPTVIIINKTGNNQGFQPTHNSNAITVPHFDHHPNREYIICSGLGHDLVLDVSGDSHQMNGNLIVWRRHGKKNQRFKVVQDKNHYGFYNIVSIGNHNLVSAYKNSKHNGDIICTHIHENLKGQSWQFEPAGHGQNRFYIKNAFGKYLDVKGGEPEKGTPVVQWDYNGGKNQIWQFHHA